MFPSDTRVHRVTPDSRCKARVRVATVVAGGFAAFVGKSVEWSGRMW